jgi:outer membrane protein TolC
MAVRALRRQGETVLADLKQARAAVEQVRGQLQQALTKIQLDLRWDPPAVDGVVTPEVQGMPVASRPATAPADDPQALAASKLDLARLYLQHGMQERAADILREIAALFPATKAAAEARRLLADLSAQPKP